MEERFNEHFTLATSLAVLELGSLVVSRQQLLHQLLADAP
jgi:hypothetical protein